MADGLEEDLDLGRFDQGANGFVALLGLEVGPDLRRDIYPNVVIVDANGYREIAEEAVAATAREVMESEL